MKDKHFTQFLKNISKELKDIKPAISEEVVIQQLPEETSAEQIARYLSTSQKRDESIPGKSSGLIQNSTASDNKPASPENIEQQRWNDPLRPLDQKFVTFKDMNDHYSLFLNRIQQQMSTIGGGGEVRFSRLDDINAVGAAENKFLTFDPITKKYVFEFLPVGDGLQLSENPGIISTKTSESFGYESDGTMIMNPASSTTIGGIKAGPGVAVDPQGILFIDSEGVPFTFGDFTGLVGTYPENHPKVNTDYALLGSINTDEDIVIASNGTGGVKVIGEFEVYDSVNGPNLSLLSAPYFEVKNGGQVRISVSADDELEAGVEIIGRSTGKFLPPGQTGTMLHLTGNPGTSNRVYHDSVGNYSSYIFRRYNGTVDAPTAVLANQDVGRFNATAATTSGLGGVALAQIRITALENQTPTAQGSSMTFTVTPIGSPATNRVDVMSITEASGVTATKFTGPLIGNADTSTTATNLDAATDILAGTVIVDPPLIPRVTSNTQTVTIPGLTTNHKVIVISQTEMEIGITISAAYASAANTLSIQFVNSRANTDTDPSAKTIQYFAWI